MAFNPFHGFRKHQKSVFAVMVIVCMFVFILQFGAGDVFTRMLNWFGGSRNKGQVVATLNGHKVHESDLGHVSRNRQLAAGVVFNAALEGIRSQAPQAQQMGQTPAQRVFQGVQQGEFPFGSLNRVEDLLDFMVWRAKADQLGITLTEADVRKAINRIAGKDVFGGKPFASSILAVEVLRGGQKAAQGMTTNELLQAVTDEFRVVLAQEALLGYGPGTVGGGPSRQEQFFGERFGFPVRWPETATPPVTPSEFLQYYREQRATLRVWMLPVAVDDFVAEAKRTKQPPSDEILQRLFENYRGQEPSPERDRPAFKEPARVKAEWVSASPDGSYFREQAKLKVEALPYASYLMQLAVPGIVASPAGAAAPWFSVAAAPFSFERSLVKYDDFQKRERDTLLLNQDLKHPLHDRSLTHPAPIGFLLGNALSAGFNPLSGMAALPDVASAWFDSASVYENAEVQRVMFVQLSLLGGLASPPLGGGVIPPLCETAYASPLHFVVDKEGKVQPLQDDYWQMRDRLLAEIRNDEVASIIDGEMTALSKEIAKDKSSPEAARKKIDEAVKKLGLKHGAMKTAEDRFALEKDDSLKTLREDFLDSRGGGGAQNFSNFLLTELKGLYDPKDFKRLKRDSYLIWQTELVKAREPKTLSEARDKVLEAWYYQEARNLARLRAAELSNDAKTRKDSQAPPEIIKHLREQGKNDGFTLNDVARLVSQAAVEGAGGKSYHPYAIETSKIALPRSNTVDTLVKQLKEPGDTTIVSDQPEKIYYVALLEARDNQTSLSGFEDVFRKSPQDDKLWETMMNVKRRDYQKMVVKQLRSDAGVKDGEYELPNDVRLPGAESPGE